MVNPKYPRNQLWFCKNIYPREDTMKMQISTISVWTLCCSHRLLSLLNPCSYKVVELWQTDAVLAQESLWRQLESRRYGMCGWSWSWRNGYWMSGTVHSAHYCTTDSVACATAMFLRVPDAICFRSQLKVLTFEPSASLLLLVSTGSMDLQWNWSMLSLAIWSPPFSHTLQATGHY